MSQKQAKWRRKALSSSRGHKTSSTTNGDQSLIALKLPQISYESDAWFPSVTSQSSVLPISPTYQSSQSQVYDYNSAAVNYDTDESLESFVPMFSFLSNHSSKSNLALSSKLNTPKGNPTPYKLRSRQRQITPNDINDIQQLYRFADVLCYDCDYLLSCTDFDDDIQTAAIIVLSFCGFQWILHQQARIRKAFLHSSLQITDLTEGTLVEIIEKRTGKLKISAPIHGWMSIRSKLDGSLIIRTTTEEEDIELEWDSNYNPIVGTTPSNLPSWFMTAIRYDYPNATL